MFFKLCCVALNYILILKMERWAASCESQTAPSPRCSGNDHGDSRHKQRRQDAQAQRPHGKVQRPRDRQRHGPHTFEHTHTRTFELTHTTLNAHGHTHFNTHTDTRTTTTTTLNAHGVNLPFSHPSTVSLPPLTDLTRKRRGVSITTPFVVRSIVGAKWVPPYSCVFTRTKQVRGTAGSTPCRCQK